MNSRLDAVINEIQTLDDLELDQVYEFILELKTDNHADELWLKQAREMRQRLQSKYGVAHFGSIATVIEVAREERLDDLMGRD